MAIREITFQNHKLKLHITDEADHSVLEEIFLDREYRSVEGLIKEAKDPILDIGAHKGFFAIYCACLNSSVKVFSYEPESENFSALKKNLELNNIKTVQPKNVAVSDRSAPINLHIAADSHNHSIHGDSENCQKVNSLTLSQLLDQNSRKQQIDRYSLAKIDCESAEFAIFASTESAKLTQIANFYIETHKPEVQPIITKLNQAGFKTRFTKSKYDPHLGFVSAKSQ